MAEERWSVACPQEWWYPACMGHDLGSTPVALTLMDLPLVVYRDRQGVAHALVDRCPHRNVPLSLGRVHRDGTLECAYHGWRFDGGGRCTAVPALETELGASASPRDAVSRPVREQDGVVWVWGSAEVAPHRDPYRLPDLGTGANVGEVVFQRDIDCTMHAALENALDVPHTAFLHGGLFRKSGQGPRVEAERQDLPDGVEVRFVGEPAAFGPLRLPDATFDHWDRFFLPSVAQIEYRVGDAVQIVNNILHLPLSAKRTRAWFVLRFRSPLPARALAPIVRTRGKKILEQDVTMLEAQTANAARFGGERYTSTDLDLLGNAIWRLLRQAERAEGRANDGTEVAIGSSKVTLQL
jgi:phenylpropionate dioxygenase-like ring-hydroxylating dioxygenase large terminal subunit